MRCSIIILRACFFIFTIIMPCISAAHAKSEVDAGRINSFLNLISHDWKGAAVQTPIGPVTYNIKFLETSDGHVKGAAYLRRSTHYWDFYQASDQLSLEFLTTFAGNDVPIIFQSHHYSDQGFEFNSISRNDVKVIIKPETGKMVIIILLNDKMHVNIMLER